MTADDKRRMKAAWKKDQQKEAMALTLLEQCKSQGFTVKEVRNILRLVSAMVDAPLEETLVANLNLQHIPTIWDATKERFGSLPFEDE